MVVTLTVTSDRIDGFNSYGERYSAAFNAAKRFNVGEAGKTSHAERIDEVETHLAAIEWVTRRLTHA